MLLERAAGLSNRIAQYNQLKGTAEEAALFETRANQFATVAAKLQRTRNLLLKLRDAGVRVEFVPIEGAAYVERARTLRAAIQADPHVLANPPFDLKYEFTARLLAIHEAAEKAMLEAWQTHVLAQADARSDDMLNTLAAIPQFKPIVVRMRQCMSEIRSLASIIPEEPRAGVARLTALAAAHRAAWEEMTADGIPSPVITFLKACAAEGAPLISLTDEVRNWLAQRNLLSVFRIRI
jgi:hypothetical protein